MSKGKKSKEKTKTKTKKAKEKEATGLDKEALARLYEEDHARWYELTWGTPVGQDCIYLNKTLAGWLGERLVFFAKYGHTQPFNYESDESWEEDLRKHGQALLHYAKHYDPSEFDAHKNGVIQALEYVAQNYWYLHE